MALKKPSQQAARNIVTAEAADALANKLADKPYGSDIQKTIEKVPAPAVETVSRTTISLPDSMLIAIEDLARDNKRKGVEPKNVSAIVREALSAYLNK